MAKRGRPRHPDILTPREWEVLELLREGLSNPEIATRLGIGREGVKYHVSEILGKLGVTSREEAAAWQPSERRPWWLAAATPGLLWRRLSAGWLSPAVTGVLAVGVAAGAVLLIWALMTTGDAPPTSTAVSNGTLRLPQGAITALENFAFTTKLDVSAADGDYALEFDGVFQKPYSLQGTLRLDGSFLEFAEAYSRPSESEVFVRGDHVRWREPGGDWQLGIEKGYETIDPMVGFRQYVTPWFYLEALRFDEIELPVAGEAESINGVRAIPVRLDRQGVIDLIAQGTGSKRYPDEEEYGPGVPTANAAEVLPQQFNIEVWFEENDLYPARIVFDYAITEADYSTLAFGFEDPLTLRLQMDIVEPDAGATIEPPIPIPTETPTPTTPPGEFLPGQLGLISGIVALDPRVAEIAGNHGSSISLPHAVWRTSDLEVLGGYVYVNMREPFTYEGAWPSVIYDESETTDPPFREIEETYRTEQITRLLVLVYLPEARVVEIVPEGVVIRDAIPAIRRTPSPGD